MDVVTVAVAAVAAAAVAIVYGLLFGRSRVTIQAEHAHGKVQRLVRSCPSLQSTYRAAPLVMNGHVMAVVATVMHNQPRVEVQREMLQLSDGGETSLDWAVHENIAPRDAAAAPIVLALHGLVGHSRANYMQHFLERVASEPRAFRCCVMNARGCGETPLRTAHGFTAGHTQDVRECVESLRSRWSSAPIVAVAFSLGANILVKYMGEEGARCPLAAGVSVSNPFDLEATDRHMLSGFVTRHVYNRRMTATLQSWFLRNAAAFAEILGENGAQQVMKARTVREFDQAYVVPVYKFRSVDEYYRSSSSVHHLPSVAVPLLAINALDDPICPPSTLPSADVLRRSPHVVQVTTERGSHVAWLEGFNPLRRRSWVDAVICEYISAVFASSPATHTAVLKTAAERSPAVDAAKAHRD